MTLKYKYIDIKFLGKFINFSKREYSRILSIQKINIVHVPWVIILFEMRTGGSFYIKKKHLYAELSLDKTRDLKEMLNLQKSASG